MKKKYFLCISCLLLTMLVSRFSFSQTETPVLTKHQLSIGTGLLTAQELMTGISAIASDVVGQDVDDIKSSGALTLSYRYFPSPQWGIGIVGIYEKLDINYTSPTAKSTFNTLTIMANGQFNYIARPQLDLYSRLGAGFCNFNQTGGLGNSTDNVFAFQVTAIGVRTGVNFGAFVELGFGYEGLLHAGFMLRL